MGDIVDEASVSSDRELELRIAAARGKATARLPVPGQECREECGHIALLGSHFCGADCRDAFERRERIRRKQGMK